jgi:monofunctional biosynthetic peptidoglycan transglycosylase
LANDELPSPVTKPRDAFDTSSVTSASLEERLDSPSKDSKFAWLTLQCRGVRSWFASSRRRRLLVAFILLSFLFLVWFVPFVPTLWLGSVTVKRLDSKGQVIDSEVGPSTPQWVPIQKVSRHVIHAVIAAEDAKFYQHNGFDFEAIGKAIELNKRRGRYVRGASTISQQVVKMAFLSREKTIIRKVREAAGTVLLELLLPKERILEWYLNLCEFGGGIYGVKQAGRHYFKTRPELLTIEQAVHLAVVIPSPNKWSKGLRTGSLTPFGQRRFSRIVKNMHQSGYISASQRNTALARGNFGNPIAGYAVASDDDDDCKGDRECEDTSSESSARPANPRLMPSEGAEPEGKKLQNDATNTNSDSNIEALPIEESPAETDPAQTQPLNPALKQEPQIKE